MVGVSFRERGVDGVTATPSSPDAADVLDSVDCCDASSRPAPSGPVVMMLVTGEAADGGCCAIPGDVILPELFIDGVE